MTIDRMEDTRVVVPIGKCKEEYGLLFEAARKVWSLVGSIEPLGLKQVKVELSSTGTGEFLVVFTPGRLGSIEISASFSLIGNRWGKKFSNIELGWNKQPHDCEDRVIDEEDVSSETVAMVFVDFMHLACEGVVTHRRNLVKEVEEVVSHFPSLQPSFS